MKMTVGKFRKHPYKIPESHFVGVASKSFIPLRGTNSEITIKLTANAWRDCFQVRNSKIKVICVTNTVTVFVIFSDG